MGILDDKHSYYKWRKKQKLREEKWGVVLHKDGKREISKPRSTRFRQGIICECGNPKSVTGNLCKECRVRISKEEGVKPIVLHLPQYRDLRRTGIKCAVKDCETLTERLDCVCFLHSEAISGSKKYKTNVPKMNDEQTTKRLSHDY